ncbi:MAG: hypothetical protein V1866_01630 [archaeon]
MKNSFKTGLCFGLTSATITTLGLMVGLNSGTHSRTVVISGILTIAIADAFSDSLGIHLAEESKRNNKEAVWESMITTFVSKFVFALTFLVPVLLFDLSTAMLAGIAWGLLMLGVLSYVIARSNKENPATVIGEHWFIAIIVIIITNFVGTLISKLFS